MRMIKEGYQTQPKWAIQGNKNENQLRRVDFFFLVKTELCLKGGLRKKFMFFYYKKLAA